MSRRRWLAPEVVQSSAMDCGPASLKCLLEGHGVPVSYGRLREACQTDVDGSSIDTLEEVAVQLGLDAEQVMVPPDLILQPYAGNLPAIVVLRQPNGLTHFVVLWARVGPWVQVMDPAVGREWVSARQLQEQLYVHEMAVPAEAWREYAGSDEFLDHLRRRLHALGVGSRLAEAQGDPGWRGLATLDAATRMVEAMQRSGGLVRQAAPRLLDHLLANPDAIAGGFWLVRPTAPDEDGGEQVLYRGAVLVRVSGRRLVDPQEAGPLPRELAAAMEQEPERAGATLLRLLRQDGLIAPLALLSAVALAAGAVVLEAVLLRGLLEIGVDLDLRIQRLTAVGLLGLFLVALVALELPIATGLARLGRVLETRLRISFLQKIPRLGDRYFQSRLSSDMAERAHALHLVRTLPQQAGWALRKALELVLTVVGIAVIDPWLAPLAVLSGVACLGFPLVALPLLAERELRVRSHVGALGRFYLDALLGLIPVRSHGAGAAVHSEHEALTVEWGRAALDRQRAVVAVEGAAAALGLVLAAGLLFAHLSHVDDTSSVLLLVYWALNLPVLGEQVAVVARQYPVQRSVTLRLLEPLGALDEGDPAAPAPAEDMPRAATGIHLEGVHVVAAGHPILHDVSLEVPAGSHVAIVGASGAGKSSLVGLLLGWHTPVRGTVLVDGEPLDPARLSRLRRHTAWVDPTVQLWNRTFLHNLRYGAEQLDVPLDWILDQASLVRVLEKLPEGLQTPLGESGALLSGGEGQRVRFGRALMRSGTRLVILDEPFRGLDRERRRELLSRARACWSDATLLCITHDVAQTREFPTVVVMDGGRVVERGAPEELLASDSRYRALVRAEEDVHSGLWGDPSWRRLSLVDGQVVETREGR